MCAGALTICGLPCAPAVIVNVAGMRGPLAEDPVGLVGVAVDVEGVEVVGGGAVVDWALEPVLAVLAVLDVWTLAVIGAAD